MSKAPIEARFTDLARACVQAGRPRFARFLEPNQLPLARKAAHEQGARFEAFGGYPDAERCLGAFAPDDEALVWPVRCLRLDWNDKYGAPSHRDLLGAVMAQGLERSMLGDIQLGQGCAYLFCTPEAAEYLRGNLDSAGRTRLRILEIPYEEAVVAEPVGTTIRVTLASLRLDTLVSEGYDLSRSQAQSLIERGLVKLNHTEQLRTDARIERGDLVSVRGYGRLKLIEVEGETRKGRIASRVFRYGD